MQTVSIPFSTGPKYVLPFLMQLESASRAGEVAVDFGEIQHIEPLGTLLLLSALRRIKKKQGELRFVSQPNPKRQGHEMLGHLGFWRELGMELHKVGEPTPHTVPIECVSYRHLHQQAGGRDPIRAGLVTEYASRLATVVSGSQEQTELWLALEYSFREMIRNGLEHSFSDEVWIAAMSWHQDDYVQLAILDEGIGIRKSFVANRPDLDDSAALQYALQPGVSSKSSRRRSAEAEERLMEEFPDTDPKAYDNSGYGLTFTYELAKRAGRFSIASGTAWFEEGEKGRFFTPTFHNGTAVRVNLNRSMVTEAMSQWKLLTDSRPTYSASRLLTASMMTRLGLDRIKQPPSPPAP
jgi:hypothetical protein